MKKCTLICGYKPIIKKEYEGDLFGIDKGALYLIENNFDNFISLGDFDSVSDDEYNLIKKHSKEIIKLNPIKDDTDLEHALKYIKEKGYDTLDIYGSIGGRQDHNLLNLKLIYLSDLNITAYSDKDKIFNLKKGRHVINKNGYTYLSLFTFENCLINLTGTFYPIETKLVTIEDNYTTSNEILKDSCNLDILDGRLLVIQSKD